MKNIITKGKLILDSRAEVEWELRTENGRVSFSASGGIWNSRHTDYDSCGQILNDLAKSFPSNAKMQRLHEVWSEWHLNDMNAGTPAQHAALKEAEAAAIAEGKTGTLEERRSWFYDCDWNGNGPCKEPNWHSFCRKFGCSSAYDWQCNALKERGLYEVPYTPDMVCTGDFPEEVKNGTRGYRYGERWIFHAMPAELIEEIKSW